MSIKEELTWLSWSSGKDSAWTLYQLQNSSNYKVDKLFTTINKKYGRAAMHGTSLDILKAQAQAAELPIEIIELPDPCDNATYLSIMSEFVCKAEELKLATMAFGDLFLQDIRNYREQNLESSSVAAIFPLWHQDTKNLAVAMIEHGLKAIICCVDTKQLPADFLGREFDNSFLSDLPASVDPCGENGEFHTCVYAGPMFKHNLPLQIGGIHTHGQFHWCQLSIAA